jgi:hypothetical protein
VEVKTGILRRCAACFNVAAHCVRRV